MSAQNMDIEAQIDAYLDDGMDDAGRLAFEARMRADPGLKARVEAATRSMALLKDAVGWVTPGDEFDSKVVSKIIELNSPGMNFEPETPLTANDPEAKLLDDPLAARESRKLWLVALIAVVIFGLVAWAACRVLL